MKPQAIPQRDLERLDGWLAPDEGARLCWLASQVPVGRAIVEVGSYKGKSACYLARGARLGAGALVHCVDPWDEGGQRPDVYQGVDWSAEVYCKRETFDAFLAQIRKARVEHRIRPHRGLSADVAATWQRGAVGLLFVDGDHTHDGVVSDLKAWEPHLAPSAWVAFHDYTPRFEGLRKAVDEWCDRTQHVERTQTRSLVVVRLAP